MTNHSDDTNTTTSMTVAAPKPAAAKTPAPQKRKKNALTHGIYAEDLVLEWESADDLITLRNDLWEELQPEGRLEEETLLGVVNLTWFKRRVMRTEALGFRRDPFAIEAARSNPKDFDDLAQVVMTASSGEEGLLSAAKESFDALKGAIETVREINTACLPGHAQDGPAKEAFNAAQEAQMGVKTVEKFLLMALGSLEKHGKGAKASGPSVYEKAYSHEHLEKTIRIEAALDARIDKQLARLVNLKEYKRLRKETSKAVIEAAPLVPEQTT